LICEGDNAVSSIDVGCYCCVKKAKDDASFCSLLFATGHSNELVTVVRTAVVGGGVESQRVQIHSLAVLTIPHSIAAAPTKGGMWHNPSVLLELP
jgi:hypothetical protein